jgi:hypothetical protein
MLCLFQPDNPFFKTNKYNLRDNALIVPGRSRAGFLSSEGAPWSVKG